MRQAWIFIGIIILLTGCIKEVHPHFRETGPFLVVEGLLLTDSTPCKVTLSYSGLFNENGGQLQQYINDALVYLKDDSGDSIPLYNQQDGIYMSTGSVPPGQVNRSYSLSITLADGKRYASFPEKIVPVAQNMKIDSVGVSDFNSIPLLPDLHGAEVKIDLDGSGDHENYYRWLWRGYVPRKTTGIPCSPFSPSLCHQYCYQYYEDHSLNFFSDYNIGGNRIMNYSLLRSPYYTTGRHFIEIRQLSLTKKAYQFWQLYTEQTARTGSIFDPLPSPLQGNIYNIDDSSDLVLGFFEVSDVYLKKIILKPTIYNNLILQYAPRYTEEGACYAVLSDAKEEVPAGWENAEEIEYDVY